MIEGWKEEEEGWREEEEGWIDEWIDGGWRGREGWRR